MIRYRFTPESGPASLGWKSRRSASVTGAPGRTKVALITIAITAVGALAIPAAAVAGSTTGSSESVFTATEASWTTAREPTTSQASKSYLGFSRAEDATFIKFDLDGVSEEAIASARLEVRVATTKATRPGVEVYQAPTNWTEASLNHASRPAPVSSPVNAGSTQARVGTISIPLSDDLDIGPDGSIAFELRYSQAFVGTTLYGIGSSSPKLRLSLNASGPPSVTPAPPPPTASPSPSPSPMVPAPPPALVPTSDLPFAVAASGTSEKKVFAHYFPPYPISLDNKEPSADYYARHYLNPQGEGSKFWSSGGLLRDRPEGRSPRGGDWRLADMRTEVADAARGGVDGFTVNIMSVSGANWNRTLDLAEAAASSDENFTIVPNLDLTASVKDVPVATIARQLADLYSSPAAHRLPSGEYLLSSFAAERKSVSWWSQLRQTLSSQYGIRTAFIAVFLSASDANMRAFAPISYSLGNWGVRSPTSVANAPDFAARAHALGVRWMSPVAVQDVRPRSFVYDEAGNTEVLRGTWKRAIEDEADFVQLVTWNDYSESTSFAPSMAHGESFVDINAYYQSQFKTGRAPRVTGDAVFLTHRVQFVNATPSILHRLMQPTLSGTSMKPRDTVEVMTFLTAPSEVAVTVGGRVTRFQAPSGVSTKTVPLAVGKVAVEVTRSGGRIASAASPFPVVAKPTVQDLQYYTVSSRKP